MSLHDYFIIAAAILMYLRLTPQERRRRRDQARGSSGAAMIGGAFGAIDRIVRPSVEHRIEAEQRIVKEDEKGGE